MEDVIKEIVFHLWDEPHYYTVWKNCDIIEKCLRTWDLASVPIITVWKDENLIAEMDFSHCIVFYK